MATENQIRQDHLMELAESYIETLGQVAETYREISPGVDEDFRKAGAQAKRMLKDGSLLVAFDRAQNAQATEDLPDSSS